MLKVNFNQNGGMKMHLSDFQMMYTSLQETIQVLLCALNEYSQNQELKPAPVVTVLTGLRAEINANNISITPGYITSKNGDIVPVDGANFFMHDPGGGVDPPPSYNEGGVELPPPLSSYIYVEVTEIQAEGGQRKIEETGEEVTVMTKLRGTLKQTNNRDDVYQVHNHVPLLKNGAFMIPRLQHILQH